MKKLALVVLVIAMMAFAVSAASAASKSDFCSAISTSLDKVEKGSSEKAMGELRDSVYGMAKYMASVNSYDPGLMDIISLADAGDFAGAQNVLGGICGSSAGASDASNIVTFVTYGFHS